MTVTLWATINIVFFLVLAVGLSFIFINAFKTAERRKNEYLLAASAQELPAHA